MFYMVVYKLHREHACLNIILQIYDFIQIDLLRIYLALCMELFYHLIVKFQDFKTNVEYDSHEVTSMAKQ